MRGHLERLVGIERRRDGRQPAGEHRLSGAGRSREQHDAHLGGDLQARRAREPTRIGEIDGSSSRSAGEARGRRMAAARPFGFALQAARSSATERAERASMPCTSDASATSVAGTITEPVPAAQRADECEDAGHQAD